LEQAIERLFSLRALAAIGSGVATTPTVLA
jgi:hypothetical protein